MNHMDHVNLIKKGVPASGLWADLGSGRGAFTLALAECLGTDSHIYSIDQNKGALQTQQRAMEAQFPDNAVTYLEGDFTQEIKLPLLDGIVMANSLHFVADKRPILEELRTLLKPTGRLVMVEYDTDKGNYAVPYPMSFATWQRIATTSGFTKTALLATRPSRFLGSFFSSVSFIS